MEKSTGAPGEGTRPTRAHESDVSSDVGRMPSPGAFPGKFFAVTDQARYLVRMAEQFKKEL